MKTRFLAASVVALFAVPALASDGIRITDPFARSAHGMSQSGAAFMTIENHGVTDRRLIAARSDAAARVELHTHVEDDEGVMRMVEVEEFLIPAHGTHALERGGDHIMFMGIAQSFDHGAEVSVTLVFDDGAEMELIVPVDLERGADHGHSGSQDADHGHSDSHD
ncbi:MAG: copper chaperone PCu(A)C [Rhodobacteraceae bacterium]|nr:copper chaperone PCu(A)C [Paracoccaceae bacterium]